MSGSRRPRRFGRAATPVIAEAISLMARWWFHAPIHDIYCGMRGFTRELYDRLGLNAPGMEFATEMIIKSSLYQRTYGVKIAEGSYEHVSANEDVIEAYLGRPADMERAQPVGEKNV